MPLEKLILPWLGERDAEKKKENENQNMNQNLLPTLYAFVSRSPRESHRSHQFRTPTMLSLPSLCPS
jgi:hypothetical protein